jgi:DNA polymerase-3 subunit gamma/tau
MTQALYRKWRPQQWDEVVGQQHIVQTLRNAVSTDRVAQAYLFAGPRGTGKTTVARLLAKAVNCLDPDISRRPCNQCEHCLAVNAGRFLDLIEIDAASQTGVEDVRELRDKINFVPNQGRYKVYIFDEVHMFSNNAFNALLKTLEEPPPHVIFILATTEIHKIPPTVLSRCQRHEFRRVPVEEIVKQLEHIIRTEHFKAEPEAVTLIARQSAGGLRDAISLLDQMASTGEEITLARTQSVLGTSTGQTVVDLIEAVRAQQSGTALDGLHRALDSGTDARVLARQVVEYLRGIMLIQMGDTTNAELPADVRSRAEIHAKAFPPAAILRLIKVFNTAASDLRAGWEPSLPLELALAEGMGEADIKLPETEPPRRVSAVRAEHGFPSQPPVPLPPEPQASAPETIPPAAPGLQLSEITKVWKQICAAVKPQSAPLAALLNSCKLLEVKDGTLLLGFASEILRGKADTPEQIDLASTAIFQVLGSRLAVRCVVSNAKQANRSDVKPDGMVAAALKHGGEIIETQD